MVTAADQCEHMKKDGSPCPNRVRPGKSTCWVHDPELAERRAEGRRRGGKERSRKAAVLPEGEPDLSLKSVTEVAGLLAVTINETRKGKLDPKVANAVGYLAGILLKALEGTDLARQLEELRQQVAEVVKRHANAGSNGTGTGAAPNGSQQYPTPPFVDG